VLKVTITTTPTEEKWTLQGRLDWPWVNQLRENWRKAHRTPQAKTFLVDLNELTFVDRIGERMLRIMANQGAQFVASQARANHVLESIGCTGIGGLQDGSPSKSEQQLHFQSDSQHE
jgi:anti-anti-sigma regulatory factor